MPTSSNTDNTSLLEHNEHTPATEERIKIRAWMSEEDWG